MRETGYEANKTLLEMDHMCHRPVQSALLNAISSATSYQPTGGDCMALMNANIGFNETYVFMCLSPKWSNYLMPSSEWHDHFDVLLPPCIILKNKPLYLLSQSV